MIWFLVALFYATFGVIDHGIGYLFDAAMHIIIAYEIAVFALAIIFPHKRLADNDQGNPDYGKMS